MSSVVTVGIRSPLALTVLGLLEYRPAHPYRIQQVIREWGKDRVINVGQRASLYRVIERLLAAGLIQVRETQRDKLYPERTVYEVTDAGRQASRQGCWRCCARHGKSSPNFRRRCRTCCYCRRLR